MHGRYGMNCIIYINNIIIIIITPIKIKLHLNFFFFDSYAEQSVPK